MTTINWPSALPQSPDLNYGESIKDTVIRTDMDAGPAKTRQRFTRIQREMSVSFTLTSEQRRTFYTFLGTIKGGALSFNMKDPASNDILVVRIKGGIKSMAYVSPDIWRVAFDLEVLPGTNSVAARRAMAMRG